MNGENMVRVSDPDVRLVKVENIDPGQLARRGPFQWLDEARALRGEAQGLWKIVKEEPAR